MATAVRHRASSLLSALAIAFSLTAPAVADVSEQMLSLPMPAAQPAGLSTLLIKPSSKGRYPPVVLAVRPAAPALSP